MSSGNVQNTHRDCDDIRLHEFLYQSGPIDHSQDTFFNVKIEKFVVDNSRQSLAFPVSGVLGGAI